MMYEPASAGRQRRMGLSIPRIPIRRHRVSPHRDTRFILLISGDNPKAVLHIRIRIGRLYQRPEIRIADRDRGQLAQAAALQCINKECPQRSVTEA